MGAVVPLRTHEGDETSLADTVEAYFASVDLGPETRAVYETTLVNLEQALPEGVALVDVSREVLSDHLMDRYGGLAPATFNRNLATLSSLFAWCVENDLLPVTPVKGIRRRKERQTVEAERQSRPIPVEELTEVWSNRRHPLRDRVFWVMAYDTAARADELLGLDIENIDTVNREAVIIGKGGSAERIYWTSTTARLLPKLIAGRTRGPLFVGARKPRSHLLPAASDLCEATGRARLSYRRAEEIWKTASGGRTLHQLRHSKLTHLAEAGEDVTMIKAKSRHRSLRSLERYVNPSPDAIRDLTNRHDPNRRTHH